MDLESRMFSPGSDVRLLRDVKKPPLIDMKPNEVRREKKLQFKRKLLFEADEQLQVKISIPFKSECILNIWISGNIRKVFRKVFNFPEKKSWLC